MNNAVLVDFTVRFDHRADKFLCQHSTQAVNQTSLEYRRLLFSDPAAFFQHRNCGGGIRVAFEDAERIVHGIVVEGGATDEGGIKDDIVILALPILYSDVEDVIRAIKARRKHG